MCQNSGKIFMFGEVGASEGSFRDWKLHDYLASAFCEYYRFTLNNPIFSNWFKGQRDRWLSTFCQVSYNTAPLKCLVQGLVIP